MQSDNNYFTITLIILIGITVFIVGKYRSKKRTEALSAKAKSLGMQFSNPPRNHTTALLDRFALGDRGRSNRTINEMWNKTSKEELRVLGYKYTTGSGKHSRTHFQTVYVLTSTQLNLPDFELQPENFLHKIGQAFGYQDIDFDTNTGFSKAYLLRGKNEAAIRELFSEELLRYFENNQGLCVEGQGDTILIYRDNKRIAPDEMQPFIQSNKQLISLFKSKQPNTQAHNTQIDDFLHPL